MVITIFYLKADACVIGLCVPCAGREIIRNGHFYDGAAVAPFHFQCSVKGAEN